SGKRSATASSSATRPLPWSWYADADVLRREQDAIFQRFWQYAGHLGELEEPGSFAAKRAGHLPVVLVRGTGGELRAFLNVCRHRGWLLVEGSGRRTTIQCPSHGWTYNLDGSLRAAPRSEREADFDKDEIGLVRLQVDTWGPFVFVNPD